MKGGFTLIEVMIVISILMILGSAAMVFGIDAYTRSLCQSEYDAYLSLLYKARNQAMSNVYKNSHGVHVGAVAHAVFPGNTYQANNPLNEAYDRVSSTTISSPADMVFGQLSGRVDSFHVGTTTVGDSGSTCINTIYINHEGAID